MAADFASAARGCNKWVGDPIHASRARLAGAQMTRWVVVANRVAPGTVLVWLRGRLRQGSPRSLQQCEKCTDLTVSPRSSLDRARQLLHIARLHTQPLDAGAERHEELFQYRLGVSARRRQRLHELSRAVQFVGEVARHGRARRGRGTPPRAGLKPHMLRNAIVLASNARGKH